MAEIKAVAEPPAGLYRLRFTLPIALPGRPPQERDFWFAFSPWHIRRYRIDNTNLEHWAGVTAKAPVSQRDAAALALASPFDLFGPDAMPGAFSHWFGVVADTTIDLPAGRVRVSVDRRSIVSSWYVRSPETDEAATELTAGPHAIRVEYFQGFAGAPYGSKSSPSRRKKRRAGCPHAPKANWLY